MSGGWLPKGLCLETLRVQCREDGVGRRKEWADCVQRNVGAFGIAGD